MPFPEHYLLQFGGDLRGDIWSCGIRFANDLGIINQLEPAEQVTMANEMSAHIEAWMVAAGSGWSNAAKLRFVKFNRIDVNGRYTNAGATAVKFYDTQPYPTGSFTPLYPNQIAAVLSWGTVAERGRASKGRIFLPCPAAPINETTGLVAATGGSINTGTMATQAALFLDNINAEPGLDTSGVKASVVSRVDGTSRPITKVKVGSVLDTMRSRRNALKEVYAVAAVA